VLQKLGGTPNGHRGPAYTPPVAAAAARKEVASYGYTDALGTLLYEVVRFEPKDFRQRHMQDGKWVWSMTGIERVLYNLPKVMSANVSHVIVCEGEKDVESLRSIGLVGTTNVGGAGKWLDSYSEALAGRDVIICGDNDKAGREHVANSKKTTLDLGKWLPPLGRYVRGLVAGELVAILGATASGKTACLQNIALHSYPLVTLMFEMELPGSLTFERFIQISQGMTGAQVHHRYDGGEPLVWDTDPRLENIHVCTKSRITTDELETIINKSEAKIGTRPALVIVDYAQLVHGRGTSRYERASDVSEKLKVIAKETRTVVVFGSQVQRKAKDESNEVFLHDGKESGSIENSSGLVLGAWRDDQDAKLLKIKILKNTKGQPGAIIACNFDGETLRITERSKVHDYH
jgi:hypothetical protein